MAKLEVPAVLSALALLGVCACAPAASSPSTAAPPPSTIVVAPLDDPPAPDRPVSIDLDRATVRETLSVAEQFLGERILVDARALASIGCLSIDLPKTPRIPARQGGLKLLEAIRAKGLRVEHTGAVWVVDVDPERPPTCEATPAVAAKGAGASTETDPAAEILRSIRAVSPTEHAITRRGADLFLERQSDLMRSARIVPEEVGGKVVGIRLFGIRGDSILGKLGFENGDRLERINGFAMSDPQKALEAYAALKDAKTVAIEVNRRGQPLKLVINIE